MTERDEEISAGITRMTDAFNRGDFEGATEIAHPEGEVLRSWDKAPLVGPEALREWLKPDAFQNQSVELLAVTVSGDKALVRQNMRAKGAESGIEIDVDAWAVWTFDEAGLVKRIEFFLLHEEAAARTAAGLDPDPG